ncbi:hypothetical protein LOD99_282 [Oopsacas minuta]|uniref:Uncharacterized protein n=1 Tax=Oopsacas minuta TaxID=111878 RepID=A0AAV7K8H7_9METZ|nr:hypothetical protein LOD99_282 [Oopsacas minuta]
MLDSRSSVRPPSRKPRIRSAGARPMTPANAYECSLSAEALATARRLDSANAFRAQHENSKKIFPKRRGDEFQLTSYRAFHQPADNLSDLRMSPKPTSPTRRNNPHPTLPFLQWRLPTRSLENPKGLISGNEQVPQPQQQQNENEVLTNLSNIPFPGKKLTRSRTFSGYTPREPKYYSQQQLPTSLKSAVKEENLPFAKEWLQGASDREKQTLFSMLDTSQSEEARLKSAMKEVLNADAIEGVEKWLSGADQNEKAIALKVFEDLASSNPGTPKPASAGGPRPVSRASSMGTSRSNLPTHYGAYATLPFYYPGEEVTPPDESGLIWHQKSRREPAPNVFHRASLFNVAQRNRGQHWTIHPEWPTA